MTVPQRRSTLTLLALFAVVGVSLAIYRARGVRAVTMLINVKGLPDNGLTLVPPSDPSFDGRVNALRRGKPSEMVDALKPFSVILSNKDPRSVVGHWVKFQMVRTDGSGTTYWAGGLNPRSLMDGGAPGVEPVSKSMGFAVPSTSDRLISPVLSLTNDLGIGSGAISGFSRDTMSQMHDAMSKKDIIAALTAANAELATYVSMTVSIEGAFFDDGTFVGPNADVFETQKAYIEARRDLSLEVQFALSHGKSYAEALQNVEEWANSSSLSTLANATPTDFYNYSKKTYAQDILRIRDSRSPDAAVGLALEPLRKQWPVLKRR